MEERLSGKARRFHAPEQGPGRAAGDQRPLAGQKFNQARQQLEQALALAEQQLKHAAQMDELEADQIDVTLPGRAPSIGRLHPSTIVIRNVVETFAEMGFQVWDSPEVETDEFNFGMLNFPPDHPARDMQDTFLC